ncbi:hypothetical protein FOZ61_003319 [Perkinsus olseni]|uniref:Amino acid transporter transmembrane domain-containing protein n=1 Tax=Perkinsus olseni TaxID=32597 RepID=A0A7J6MDU2_PEROL|nr:hypothetical protein FOZ61_003319 [Perkinsus olseni]KAF4674939.1 hypothetical protein FOL46_003386 [Perkinsus olseni]
MDPKSSETVSTPGGKDGERPKNGMSVLRAACSIAMTAVGIGILALPRATAESGFIGGLVTLFIAAFASYIAGLLLWKALFLNPSEGDSAMPSFEEMGYAAFGRVGSIYFGFILHLVLTAICAVLLVLLASTTIAFTKALDVRTWVAIWALACLPLSWIKEMKNVSLLAAVGVVSVCTLVVVVIVACIQHLATAGTRDNYNLLSTNPLRLLGNFAAFIFSFGFSATTPTITHNMNEPKRYPIALAIAALFCVITYASLMLLGYAAYGDSLLNADTIADAISPPRSNLSVAGWIINFVILVVVVSHFLVLYTPTALAMDDFLSRVGWVTKLPDARQRIARLSARSALVVIQALIAVAIPSVDKLVNLIGALCVIQLCFIIPIACYVKLKRMAGIPIGIIEILLYLVLLVVALIAMGVGIHGAVIQF